MITTTINLLPWREERRKQQKQDFMIMLASAAILGLVIGFAWYKTAAGQVDVQKARNNYIEKGLAELDGQIKEIKALEERRAELVSRMETIQSLQNDRPSIVYIFDQIARTLPDGVYYTEIDRKGRSFTFKGIADSNTRISALMRNLNESPWFEKPSLQTVNAIPDSESSSFELTAKLESQQHDDEGADDGKGSDKAGKSGGKK